MAKKNKKKASSKKLGEALEKFGFGSIVQHPNSALAENNIMMANAMAKSDNGLTQGLDIFGGLAKQVGGNLLSKGAGNLTGDETGLTKIFGENKDALGLLSELSNLFANGGIVENRNVEIEGNEVVETPDGQVTEFEGPSHEEGGIPVSLPVGSEVFSDRIKVAGETMAKRKKDREKKQIKAQELYDRTGDKLAKKALDKILSDNEKANRNDMEVQQIIDSVSKSPTEEKAYGGPINPIGSIAQAIYDYENPVLDENIGLEPVSITARKKLPGIETNPIPESTIKNPNEIKPSESGFNLDSLFGTATTGDALGLIGNYKQVKGAKDWTLAERNANTPNQTFFDDYGKETLNKLNDMKAGFKNILDMNNNDLEMSRNSAMSRNNNSARGINTQRALNIATDNAIDGNKSKAYANYMQMISGVDGKIADTNLKIDEVQALDQKQKADADQKDIAAFYQNMQTNAINEGKLLTSFGQAKNKYQMDSATQKILESIFPNFSGNAKTGEITGKATVDDDFVSQVPWYEKFEKNLSDLGVMLTPEKLEEYYTSKKTQSKSTTKKKK